MPWMGAAARALRRRRALHILQDEAVEALVARREGRRLHVLQGPLVAPPPTRGECATGPRPCPWTGCRYHLPGAEQTCALDVASWGGATLEQVAALLNLSVETVQAIEAAALAKLDGQLRIGA